jgi:putative transposase
MTEEKRCRCQKTRGYPSDLTDAQWERLAPLLPRKTGGRPREHPLREIVDALRYWLRSGCSWEELPHDFPPKGTVYDYFRQWIEDGTWERLHAGLREQVRKQAGKEPEPSAAILDTQSVKTTQRGGSQARLAMTKASK